MDHAATERIQASLRMVIVQSSLRCLDGEAAHAFGYRGSYDEDGIHAALSPVAATIQAHARGYVVRRRLYENQEQARCRWIEYHLSARNTAAARALGWLPRRIADARKGSPPESAKLLLRDDERRAAKGGSSPKPEPAGAVHRSAALDFPRFLAAVHVAAYHGWTATSTPRAQLPNILLWGYTWVPFFFLLSGFVLFFSKAQAEGSSVQKAREFGFTGKGKAWLWLWKRWVAVYPLFLLSLVLGVWGVPLFAHPHGQWMELLNMLLMLQAWAVELRCTDTTTLCVYVVWNEPAWFVSALFWCWLTFPFAYRQLHRMGFYSVCLCGGLLYAISCWELVVWPNLPAELLLQADRIGAITARNPLANANKFLLGAVLGRLLLLRCHVLVPDTAQVTAPEPEAYITTQPPRQQAYVLQLQRLPCWIAFAATPTTAAILACFFLLNPDQTLGREAIIVGLYSLLIVSLAAGRDPLARLLEWPVLAWWGKLSYAIYILHSSVLAFTSQLTMREGWLPDEQYRLKAFFPILLLFALLGHFGVERPTAAFYGKPPAWLCGGFCARVQSYDEEERRARRARVLPDGSLPVSHQLHSQLAV